MLAVKGAGVSFLLGRFRKASPMRRHLSRALRDDGMPSSTQLGKVGGDAESSRGHRPQLITSQEADGGF